MTEEQFIALEKNKAIEQTPPVAVPTLPDAAFQRQFEMYLPYLEALRTKGKGVAAKLYLSGTQSPTMTVNPYDLVQLDNTAFASGMTADPVTHRLTVITPGLYHVSGKVSFVGATSGTVNLAIIYVNGVANAFFQAHAAATSGALDAQVSTLLSLKGGDYLELRCYGTALQLNSGEVSTYLYAFKL